ncbi:hypothetical protein CHU95_16215 [Niveispirillum lacus]|uniref:Uncharacterized protein n=1 Tax=Niveispirillum lacus TaxID=1981099 RepID=A0A255YT08_9PROT|nr:hypothetical protein [Niveispirillum lacus]OYQ32348.1 hypothetical protein CHU95_16215 [Niveispirillum lacus]
MRRFGFPLLLSILFLPSLAQATTPSMSAAEKAQKQAANEEAERLCKSIKDQDKFNECLDLYFLDPAKFQAFLEQNGVTKPSKPPK